MHLEKHIGKVIMINMRQGFAKDNSMLLQTDPQTNYMYAKLTAFDTIGLWIENPEWKTTPVKTGQEEKHLVQILIPYFNSLEFCCFNCGFSQ
jgi:endo-1,4-beta-D-glucanase Y